MSNNVKYTSLGKEIRISPKTLVIEDESLGEAYIELNIGNKAIVIIDIPIKYFKAIKQGEEVTTTTLKEFKKQILK